MPIILLGYRLDWKRSRAYWWLLMAYLVAKLCEHFDQAILDLLGVISGHSLKHVFAAIGLFVLADSYRWRNRDG